jgi:hypothetical protein
MQAYPVVWRGDVLGNATTAEQAVIIMDRWGVPLHVGGVFRYGAELLNRDGVVTWEAKWRGVA